MKRIGIVLLIMFFCGMGSSLQAKKYSVEAERVLVKNKVVDFYSDKILTIRNISGDITLKNWDKPQVAVTVVAKASASRESTVNRLLESASCQVDKGGWKFTSNLNNEFRGKNGRSSLSVNYTIYAPRDVKIDLTAKFGKIWVESVSNESVVDAKFVSLQLENTVNTTAVPFKLYLEFVNAATIGSVKNLKLKAKFSQVSITEVEKLISDTKFSDIRVEGSAETMDVETKHDKLRVESLAHFKSPSAEFSELVINNLSKTLSIDRLKFGELEIDNLLKGFEEISVEASFAPVRIGIGKGTNYEVDLSTEYGSISVPEDLEIIVNKRERNYQQLKGKNAKSGTKGSIWIENKHAKIRIK